MEVLIINQEKQLKKNRRKRRADDYEREKMIIN